MMMNIKKFTCVLLSCAITFSNVSVVKATENDNAEPVVSDVEEVGDDVVIEDDDKPYLALGENLTKEQRRKVLDLMGIEEENLADYDVVYVNNKEEHEYLGSYISSSEIGTKSLSSVVITQAAKGDGLNISAYNINYCTIGMYKNACATAGVEDANIIIAAPFSISGTAALVGIFKAYQEMTGEEMSNEVIDVAMDELVTTGELNESIDADPQQVEALIADLKNQLESLDSEEDIKEAVLDTARKYNVELSDNDLSKLTQLLQKLKDTDIDWDSIADQASDWADKLKDLDLDIDINTDGLWDKICEFFKSLLESLKNLFGK